MKKKKHKALIAFFISRYSVNLIISGTGMTPHLYNTKWEAKRADDISEENGIPPAPVKIEWKTNK